MKYVIKTLETGEYAASTSLALPYWPMTMDIGKAQSFDSISDILDVIAVWGSKKPQFNFRHTIVGLQRLPPAPQYKEVSL